VSGAVLDMHRLSSDPVKLALDLAEQSPMALNAIYNAIDSKVFEQIKDCEKLMRCGRDWRKHMRAHRR
jgi:hypothetical protein